MWSLLSTIFSFLLKVVLQKAAKRKLSDDDFLRHIEAHQAKRRGAGKTANDFDDAMAEAARELEEENKPE